MQTIDLAGTELIDTQIHERADFKFLHPPYVEMNCQEVYGSVSKKCARKQIGVKSVGLYGVYIDII